MGRFDYVPPPPEDDVHIEASIKALIEQRECILAKMREEILVSFTKLVNENAQNFIIRHGGH